MLAAPLVRSASCRCRAKIEADRAAPRVRCRLLPQRMPGRVRGGCFPERHTIGVLKRNSRRKLMFALLTRQDRSMPVRDLRTIFVRDLRSIRATATLRHHGDRRPPHGGSDRRPSRRQLRRRRDGAAFVDRPVPTLACPGCRCRSGIDQACARGRASAAVRCVRINPWLRSSRDRARWIEPLAAPRARPACSPNGCLAEFREGASPIATRSPR